MNPILSFIALLDTPIARRKGIVLSKEDCAEWVEELRAAYTKLHDHDKK
jgi:hypothetical protein